jgi:hypothetical protein
LEEAVAGAAGNNISGSSSTSKLTDISDNKGRLLVNHTDVTLVTGDAITLRYQYIPNYYNNTAANYGVIQNDLVSFENIIGDVITRYEKAQNDASDGYREVTLFVNEPDNIIRQQIVSLKTDNVNLNRQIRYTLRQKLTMEVVCSPKVVEKRIGAPVQVDIKLPVGMTADMFPLELNMETYDRTLSPDATKNAIPVSVGPSIIDVEGRKGKMSYYYTVTITLDAYKELTEAGNMKTYSTHWLTNTAENASTFYVDNKYFNQASDSWTNSN